MPCTYSYDGEIFYSKEQVAEYINRNDPDNNGRQTNAYFAQSFRDILEEKPFYMTSYTPEDLSSGKTISVRLEKLDEGVYLFGDKYFRVTNRGLKRISELKESPEIIKSKMVGANAIQFSSINDFYSGKVPMYVYDITPVDSKDYKGHAMADFKGRMGIKRDNESLISGDSVFNSYITAISDNIVRLKEARKTFRGNRKKVQEYSELIKEQEKVLSQLQATKSIRFLVDTGISQMSKIKKLLDKTDISMIDIHEGMRIANAWSNLDQVVDFMREDVEDDELDLLNSARTVQGSAAALYSKGHNMLMGKIVNQAEANDIDLSSVVDRNGNFIIRDIDPLGAYTVSGSYSSNKIEWLIDAVANKQKFLINEELHAFDTEMHKQAQTHLGNPNDNAEFMLEDYEEAQVNDETGEIKMVKKQGIISMYDRKFHSELLHKESQAITGKIKWKEFYNYQREYFDYELTAEGQKAFEDYMAEVRQDHILDIDEDIYDEDAIEAIRKKHDPQGFKNYLADNLGKVQPNQAGAVWFTKIPKEIKINPNYTQLTAAQKEYHKWFSEKFVQSYENSVFDYRLGSFDIDTLLLDFAVNPSNNLGEKFKYVGAAAVAFWKDSYSIVASGTRSETTTRVLTGQEHIKTPFRTVAEFIPKDGKKAHPVEVLTKFVKASIAFRRKREVEELLNAVNDLVHIAQRQEESNSGLDKLRLSGERLLTNRATLLAQRIEATVQDILTGRYTNEAKTLFKKQPGERGFSANKAIDSVNSLTRIRYMAWSPISATGNFLMGCVNNLTYAASGEYYTEKELTQAIAHLKGSPFKFFTSVFKKGGVPVSDEAKLVADIMYRYNMIGDVTEELVYGDSAISKLFALQKGGEFMVQGASTIAQLLHIPVTLANGKVTNLFKLYKLLDGQATLDVDQLAEDSEFRNPETIRKIFDKAKAVNEKIHGDYSHVLLGKKTPFGRMLFLFRTWLPMAVKERFGAEYQHRLLGAQKGRYRSAWSMVTNGFSSKEGAMDLAKTFLKLLSPGFSRRINLSDNIAEVDRKNIELFVREIQMYLMIATMVIMAKSAQDDDDDETSGLLRYMINQGERIQSELSMFAVPTSFVGILQNVIPMTNTLVDAQKVGIAMSNYISDPEKDIYTRGFRKGHSKVWTKVQQFLPLTRAAQSTWSSFSQIWSQQSFRK